MAKHRGKRDDPRRGAGAFNREQIATNLFDENGQKTFWYERLKVRTRDGKATKLLRRGITPLPSRRAEAPHFDPVRGGVTAASDDPDRQNCRR